METTTRGSYRVFWADGKENGTNIMLVFFGIVKNQMEITIIYWGYIGIMEWTTWVFLNTCVLSRCDLYTTDQILIFGAAPHKGAYKPTHSLPAKPPGPNPKP